MKRFLTVIGLLASIAAMGQETVDSGIASVAMPASRIPRTLSALSMGGTDNLESPATFALGSTKLDAEGNFLMWNAAAAYKDVNLNADMRFGKLSLKVLGSYDIGSASASLKTSNMMAGAGVGFAITDFLSIGATGKYLGMSLGSDTNLSAFCGDVMMAAKFGGFNAALGVRELGTKVSGYSLPTSVALGLGYGIDFGEKNRVDARADFDYYLCKAISLGAGARYCWNNMVSLSAGYHYGGVVGNFASVGGAVTFKGLRLGAVGMFGSGLNAMMSIGYTF